MKEISVQRHIYIWKQFLFRDRHLHMKEISVQRQTFTYGSSFCSETGIYIWKQFLFRDIFTYQNSVCWETDRPPFISTICIQKLASMYQSCQAHNTSQFITLSLQILEHSLYLLPIPGAQKRLNPNEACCLPNCRSYQQASHCPSTQIDLSG